MILLISCIASVVAAPLVSAQTPRLRLETIAPASQVRKLVFSEDGDRLYSAGRDKVVRTWEIDKKNGRYKLIPGHKFRWEISRGVRGHIYDVEVSAKGLIAFAGSSAWGNTADVAVYDISSRKLVKKLFTRTSVPSKVADLAFSPTGGKLAAMTEHGELRCWDVQQWQEKTLQKPTPTIQPFRALCFRNETQLISTEARPQGKVELVIRDITQETSQPLKNVHWPVTRIERTIDGGFLAAYRSGEVVLFSKENKPLLLRKPASGKEALTAFTLIGDKHMALSVTTGTDFKGSRIEYWDIAAKKVLETFDVSNDEYTHAITASPEGKLLAYAYGQKQELRLIQLVEEDTDKVISQPFSASPVDKVSCELQEMFRVACNPTPGSSEIGLVFDKSEGKTISQTFDPSKSKTKNSDVAVSQWRTGESDRNAFSLKIKKVDEKEKDYFIEVFNNGAKQGTVRLDQYTQGPLSSYCWIAQKDRGPVALAIGTRNQNGIFVYDLRKASGGALPLLRYYRDHEGAVLSLATTADRKQLVSVSEDRTCKIWSLEGLLDSHPKFGRYAAWGAVLTAGEDNTVVVDEALKSGIAFARKLTNGTRIVKIVFSRDGKRFKAESAQEMMEAIRRGRLMEGLEIYYKVPGDENIKGKIVTPAWEPMLTTIFSKNGQWAAWAPNGYYNASPLGDEMFGWQLNPPTQDSGSPDFYRSDQFRKDFEKPEAIEKLLSLGNIVDALDAMAGPSEKVFAAKESNGPRVEVDISKKLVQSKKLATNLAAKPKTAGSRPLPNSEPASQDSATKKPVEKEVSPKELANDVPPAKAKPLPVPKKNVQFVALHKIIKDMAPGIEILSPTNGEKVREDDLALDVQIVLPSNSREEDFDITGRLNGAFLSDPVKKKISKIQTGTQIIYRWKVSNVEDGHNNFAVKVKSKLGERKFGVSQSFRYIAPTKEDKLPQLFVVGIAAGQYRGELNLQFPVKDVRSVMDLLPAATAKNYKFKRDFFFRDQQIDRDDFAGEVDDILEQLDEEAKSPSDLLIVHVAGHGASHRGQYFFVPPHPSLNSREELFKKCADYGVGWDQIARLADSRCKTVFILDTCFAGNVLSDAKAQLRPLVDKEAVVISASSADQLSYEDPKQLKHGVFSYCVLQALRMKADADKNDVVDLDEMISYLVSEVPVQSLGVIERPDSPALALARGFSEDVRPQVPTSSKHNFGFFPIASPVQEKNHAK